MELSITNLALDGVRLIRPVFHGDQRGYFLETHHCRKYAELGLTETFVQDNHSRSVRGTLRGLHFQLHHPQAKLVLVTRGSIWDVAVDIRRGSPTFGGWVGDELSDENHAQLFIPRGFAHGFCVLSDTADVWYKCTDYYDPTDDHGVLWSDPDLAISWPVSNPLVSGKDVRQPRLCDVAADQLPVYGDR
jgi:dTDP-4-dehydrorhamnose 3,5-epimerase